MRLSTQTDCIFNTFGEDEGLRLFARAGFKTLDYSMFSLANPENPLRGDGWRESVQGLRGKAEALGIAFNQTHAPFPSYKENDAAYSESIYPALVRSIEISGVLGAEQVIIHPTQLSEKQKEFNIGFYKGLEKCAAENNVKIALENMFGWSDELRKIIPNVCSLGAEFAGYMDALNPAHFTACLDLGHAGLTGETAAQMIKTLGHKRLTALHVHDNDCRSDYHMLPFTQQLNWENIILALREIDYSGDFTFEADSFLARLPVPLRADGLIWMKKVGDYFVERLTAKD